jgi:hypothetical protein
MSDRIPTPAQLDSICVQASRFLRARQRHEEARVQNMARPDLVTASGVAWEGLNRAIEESGANCPHGWPLPILQALEDLWHVFLCGKDLADLAKAVAALEDATASEPGDAKPRERGEGLDREPALDVLTGAAPPKYPSPVNGTDRALPTDRNPESLAPQGTAPAGQIPEAPKRKQRKKGEASLLLTATLDSLAAKDDWGKTDCEIIGQAGISRDSFYRLTKEDEEIRSKLTQYRRQSLGRGPARADDR